MRLSRKELLSRLNRRSFARYGGGFSEPWLNDLIKDGLLPALIRTENDGRRPTYSANVTHYRRALQLKRFHNLGIRGRDAQLLQLFVRGYGVKPWQIREPLQRELVRVIETLRAQLRSGYFQNTRAVGPGHMARIAKQAGPLDERFKLAGFEQPIPFYLEAMRAAFGLDSADKLSLFENWLLIYPASEESPEPLRSALLSDDATFIKIGAALSVVNRIMFRPMLGNDVIDSPEFTATSLATMLIAEKSGFSVELILSQIARPEGFQALIKNALHAFQSQDKFSSQKIGSA
jgi:hypothetical protein